VSETWPESSDIIYVLLVVLDGNNVALIARIIPIRFYLNFRGRVWSHWCPSIGPSVRNALLIGPRLLVTRLKVT
jgi:hypothetical protein